jgi:hypothetical protein
MQGIVGTGVCFYLQTWCVDMKGPVFLAMWNPLSRDGNRYPKPEYPTGITR